MKIRYICHATLLIEAGGCTFLTDPWMNGPAYCDQWYPFPKPIEGSVPDQIDCMLISHGHEDHFHERTLVGLPKEAQVFFPLTWYSDASTYLRSLGFSRAKEAVSDVRYRVGEGVYVTFIGHGLDSIIVIEAGGEVLVNVNDALHSAPQPAIEYFTDRIRKKWPRIRYVFCGFGGASLFPNTFRAPGKDDVGVAEARELLFVRNFCEIVRRLDPEIGVPFAADYVLLNPEHRWINEIRIPRNSIPRIYQENFKPGGATTVVHDMYPGDRIDGLRLEPSSPYRNDLSAEGLTKLIETQYADELRFHASVADAPLAAEDAERLRHEIEANAKRRFDGLPETQQSMLHFDIRVTDVADANYYHVDLRSGSPRVSRSETPDPRAILELRTRSAILRYSFGSDWGGDAITIGCGVEIRVASLATVTQNLDVACIRLLTSHPVDREYLKRPSWRGAQFILHNPIYRDAAFKLATGRRDTLASQLYGGSRMYDRDLWLTRTKCEICQACSLPTLPEGWSGPEENDTLAAGI